ncbi:MAG: MFS transporter, partial [Candidatus Delongbacteria bacterium]|nr:MFS transporter [Candidatus Delongbacteria bacterium]
MSVRIRAIPYTIKRYFPAFRHKNYRLFWYGQSISLSGTWMQTTAQAWLVYELTKSPFLLGLIGAFQFTPVMLFSLIAGVYLDRFPKKQIILVTQTISMFLALLMTILVMTDHVQFWHIAIIVTILGFVNTLDMPTRQSFMIEIVGKTHLTSAIALNSVTFNLARIVGPAIGGILIAKVGIGFCFLLNAISFMAVIISVKMIKNLKVQDNNSYVKKTVLKEIKEGLTYIRHKADLFRPLIILAVVSTFAINFNVLIPVYAKMELNTDARGFGFLLSSLGIGSIVGALSVAIYSNKLNKKFLIASMPYAVSIAMILIGLSTQFYLASIFLILLGIANIMFFTSVNSTLQLNSESQYRGRVMSV